LDVYLFKIIIMRTLLLLFLISITFYSCKSDEEKKQKALMEEYTEVGDKIAKISFESLSGNLKAAMKKGGVDSAVRFCNRVALPLTDSLSKTFEVKIKRTALKLRNPQNEPDTLEAYMLDLYLQIQKMQKPMVGKALLANNNDVRYFAPIFLKKQCLKCHGTVGQEVTNDTYELIKKHYPNDQAIGFMEGELRGIWSINFGNINELKLKEETTASSSPD